jgi:hypothetical protein
VINGFMPNGDMAYIPALEEFQGELNVGGFFQSIAGQSSGYFARFTDSGLPWLAGQPLPLNATCVGAAEFAVSVAAGYPDPLYQWRKNGKPIANGPTGHGSMIGGATEASLVITNAQPMDAGIYDVIVSNSCGEVVSEPATLIVNRCGDVNGDGVVNVNDLLEVINAWGACPAPPVACPADIAPPPQGDGTVNVNDLLLVINNWG